MRGIARGAWILVCLVAACSVGRKPDDGHQTPGDAGVVDGAPDGAFTVDAAVSGAIAPPGVRNVAGSVRARSKHFALFAVTSAGGSTTLPRNQP